MWETKMRRVWVLWCFHLHVANTSNNQKRTSNTKRADPFCNFARKTVFQSSPREELLRLGRRLREGKG